MTDKYRKHFILLGLAFTIASALAAVALTWIVFMNEELYARMLEYLYDYGMEGARYRDYEIKLDVGDKIFVYTDGVPEATNANLEMFGTDRMIDALNTDPGAAPEDVLRNVRASVDGFVGAAEQFDDLTMVCLEYRG